MSRISHQQSQPEITIDHPHYYPDSRQIKQRHTLGCGLVLSAMVVFGLSACATKPSHRAHVNAAPKVVTNAKGVPNYYLVQRGDTVSQIATRYGLNYRQVGAINRLDSQYTIYVGQWLKLWESGSRQGSHVTYATRQPAQITQTRSTTVTRPYTQPQPVTTNVGSGFRYPTSNQVMRQFDASSGNIGMWFAGKSGDPVYASSAGTVLYAGSGLAEYGNLIMIRHGDRYVTAYAHNSQLLVSEGQQVQAGQQIATMGQTGNTNQVALEFQIRDNGNPIDPRVLLGR